MASEKLIRKTCFAYYTKDKNGEKIASCKALKKLDCMGCPFFKEKEDIENNLFYSYSFKSKAEQNEAMCNYRNKYGQFKDEDDTEE